MDYIYVPDADEVLDEENRNRLKLLTQNKAPCVKVGSGNWETICNLKKDDRLDSTLMNYKISPAENYDGNYIEFETSDRNLLETIRKFINRFYHSSNQHFKTPDFENDLFGVKGKVI